MVFGDSPCGISRLTLGLVPPIGPSPSLGSGPSTLAHAPVQGEHHLQLAHLLNLYYGRAQLPLASMRQHPLGIGGDGKDVPEA